jgi:hypothetical protein
MAKAAFKFVHVLEVLHDEDGNETKQELYLKKRME